jgi:peptidoglycan/xylan/chitin deacetylase (PgdA/CDA1 family)
VIYTVTDSSGNVATVERKIVYDDPIAPELKLKGASKITLRVGQKYKEQGYTATDNCDGDLSDKVIVQGSVNTAKAGSYTLVYTVKDTYNNTVSVSRTVNVKGSVSSFQQQLNTVTPNGKVIYLTFDDGPGERTPELLDVLRKYDVKATFFVVNSKYVNTIKRIAQEGHSIGVHANSHNYKKIYASEDAYFKDLNSMRDIITRLTGKEPTLLRFPGGSSNTVSKFNPGIMTTLAQRVKEIGLRYFDWNVDSNDAGGAKTANQVFHNVTKGVSSKQISVVLQHDTKGYSIDAVERIIRWGLQNGYTFLPLDASSPVCEHKVRN